MLVHRASLLTVDQWKRVKNLLDALTFKWKIAYIIKITVDVYDHYHWQGKVTTQISLSSWSCRQYSWESRYRLYRGLYCSSRRNWTSTCWCMHCHTVSFPKDGGMNPAYFEPSLHENGMSIHAWVDDEVAYSKNILPNSVGWFHRWRRELQKEEEKPN